MGSPHGAATRQMPTAAFATGFCRRGRAVPVTRTGHQPSTRQAGHARRNARPACAVARRSKSACNFSWHVTSYLRTLLSGRYKRLCRSSRRHALLSLTRSSLSSQPANITHLRSTGCPSVHNNQPCRSSQTRSPVSFPPSRSAMCARPHSSCHAAFVAGGSALSRSTFSRACTWATCRGSRTCWM